MRRIPSVVALMAMTCVLFGWTQSVAGQAEELAALAAAKDWLALVDAGNYAESWETSSSLMRGAVTRDHWTAALNAVRKPLGKVLSRTEKNKKFTRSLPGAPDGEYVMIQFDTSYENKKSAVETITPMKDKDGKWRVSGYFIK